MTLEFNPTDSWEMIFERWGLISEAASKLASSIPKDIFETQTPQFWFEKYIHNFLNHSQIQLSEILAPVSCNSSIYNKNVVLGRNGLENFQLKDFDQFFSFLDPKKRLFFLGIDMHSVEKLLDRGSFQGLFGKPEQDFSHGKGIYFDSSFRVALERVRFYSPHEYGVLVYAVDLSMFSDLKVFDETKDKKEWQEFVSKCRSGNRRSDSKPCLGPICGNPLEDKISSSGVKKIARLNPVDLKVMSAPIGENTPMQLCVTKESDFALMDSSLIYVFEKNRE